MQDTTPHAVEVNSLWFSYEVAQNTSATAKTLDKSTRTTDGGLSVDAPRRQHEAGMEITYKLQLADVNMTLPVGARCMLVGANGAGKTTLMSIVGGKHKISDNCGEVRVLGRAAFEDTALSTQVALLTGNWTQTVAFVGHNVPYQAMDVSKLIASASTGVDPARVARLTSLLEIDPSWNLTTVSDGQRRRVQILCKLLKPFSVLLLDEITTDLDLLARHDLLAFLREESEQRGVTILYCTHIFDGLDGWASHIAYVAKGELVFAKATSDLEQQLALTAEQRATGWGELFCAVQRWLLDARPDFAAILAAPPPPAAAPAAATPTGRGAGAMPLADAPAVQLRDFSWNYSPSSGRPNQLSELSFELPRGARCLLVGANGAGKSTLLRLLGGKHMVPRGAVRCLGYDAFHAVELNTMVALLSGDWTRQVACVGNGVPFQADFSVGSMASHFADALIRDGYDAAVVHARLERLVSLLDMDLSWRLHQVSDGQRRRAQLLLKLLRPSALLLMDEVTTDLDVVSRQALLHFLREECELRGATVIYSTHILDGLDGWPSHVLRLESGRVGYCGPLDAAPKEEHVAPLPRGYGSGAGVAAGSGSLFSLVMRWLLSERARKLEAKHEQCDTTPSTEVSMAEAAPPPPEPAKPAPTMSSRFDRFGGASRQNMYAR